MTDPIDNATDVDSSRLKRFFDEDTLESNPTLVGSKCADCGEILFPSLDRCSECFGDTRSTMLSRKGILYTHATVGMGPEGFPSPYTIGYVDLPEGIRIFTTITGGDVEIGEEMEVTTGTIYVRDSTAVKGYQFRPAKGEA